MKRSFGKWLPASLAIGVLASFEYILDLEIGV